MTWLKRGLLAALIALGAAVVLVVVLVGYYTATLYHGGDPQRGHLAIIGATVLVGEELEPRTGVTVLIHDGVITDVGTSVEVPTGARILDLAGRTVLPGLTDMHVHLGSPARDRGEDAGPLHVARIVADALRYVPGTRRALLDHGVTAVRDLGDEHVWVTDMRRMIGEGELEGPRVFAAGPVFTTAGGHPVVTFGIDPASDGVRVPATPEEARREVAELAAGPRRVDVIKVVQERGSPRRSLGPIPRDVLRAIVAEAHEHGLRVTAHWGTPEDLADVLDAGVDGLEHVESREVLDAWPEGTLEEIVVRDIPLTPTLAVTKVAVPSDAHERLRERVGEFHAAGGRIVVGSDAGVPGIPFGAGVHRELELLVASGLTPQAALRAATSEAARVLGTREIGAIEAGRAADLLVVAGDPLADIGVVRHVVLVLREGRVVVDNRQE
jgi:enamidase